MHQARQRLDERVSFEDAVSHLEGLFAAAT